MIIREAAATDLDAFTDMMEQFCRTDAVSHAYPPGTAERTLYYALQPNSNTQVWMLEAEQEIVGYGITVHMFVNEYGPMLYLDELFFTEKARGHGYGKEYLNAMADYARAHDLCTLQLFVSPANQDAARLYRREGFREEPYIQMLKELCDK